MRTADVRRLGVLAVTSLAMLTCLAMVAPRSEATVWSSQRAYSFGRDYSSGASWNAARANIEVRSGAVGSGDLSNKGFIGETLWVGDLNDVSWVEVGYSRGWGTSDVLTAYWACNTNADNYYQHRVVNITLDPGTTPKFRISKHAGVDNAWDCAIGGIAANDSSGDNTANSSIGNNFDSFDCGMESNCSSGEIGTSSNNVNVTNMEKSSDGGDNYSNGPGYTYRLTDPSSYSHGGWNTTGQSSHNYRQH